MTVKHSTSSAIHRALDAYGAPKGDTVHDRLRAWEQRERALRALAVAAMRVKDYSDAAEYITEIRRMAAECLDL